MTFLQHFRPSREQSEQRACRRGTAHFHGGMSIRCLIEANRRGSASLLTYLLAWHLHHLRKQDWIELSNRNCGIARLSGRQRQEAVRRLSDPTPLVHVRPRRGRPTLVLPIDPWGDSPGSLYFQGYMSFRCLAEAAAASKGAALGVYVIAHHEFNLSRKEGPIRLGKRQRDMLELKRSSWNRAIRSLAERGLLRIYEQRVGASPRVIPLDDWRPDFPPAGHPRPAADAVDLMNFGFAPATPAPPAIPPPPICVPAG